MTSTLKPGFFGKGSVVVGPAPQAGEGPIRRTAITADKLVTKPHDEIETVPDVVAYAARTYGTKDALGWRDIVDIHEEEKDVKKLVDGKEVTEKKKWKYFQLSDYKYINFVMVQDAINEIARGLVHIGVSKDDVFNIYAATSLNWQLISHACARISTPFATAYDTLGESGLTHSLNEPNCIGLFTNDELLPTLSKVLKNTPSVKFVIYDGTPKPAVVEAIQSSSENMHVLSIDELRELGRSQPEDTLDGRAPSKETLACIMYTSGSTGAPKGVMLSHGNLIASIGAVKIIFAHHLTLEDMFIAYLPLAHILEYSVELYMLFSGVTVGYARVKTLTDASVRHCSGDLVAFKPTVMVGVPAIWEMIRKGIISKVNAAGLISKTVFSGAMTVKRAGVPGLTQLADSTVFSNVRAVTGGRLRLGLSGGAALSRETQEFLSIALVTIVQGYGMTESGAMCSLLPPELMQYGSVGLPMPCIEIKFLDVPEAGYLSTNDPPRGEVCVRGHAVTKGYYKRDDLNNDETIFTKDGWLRTGDVGQWNPDGTLSLIDRIKNLVKLQGGEYIALERLESTYKACDYVGNICVHATADAKQPIAIIIPHEQNLRHALVASSNADSSGSWKYDHTASLLVLCQDPQVKLVVLQGCNALGKKNGFKPMEMLSAVILTPEEWTPENGLLTAAQKIQRAKIAKVFDEEIKFAYKNQ